MLISCIRLASGRCGVRRRIILSLLSGLFVSAITTPPVLAQAAMPGHVVAAHPHDAHIAEASQRFGIPTTWIIAVMRTESAGDVRAISSAGAMGLMQVMPDTWADLRIRHALGRDPFEPRDNILAGTAYLREMWDRYGNVNRPGFTGGQNSRRVARYGTDIKEEDLEAVFTRVPRARGAFGDGTPRWISERSCGADGDRG